MIRVKAIWKGSITRLAHSNFGLVSITTLIIPGNGNSAVK